MRKYMPLTSSFILFITGTCAPTCKHTLPCMQCVYIHTACSPVQVFFLKGQRAELTCHSSAEQCVYVCVSVRACACEEERGDVRLIQVLSRREDKNLLPACWASESANRREVDPNNLCPGPVRLMAQTSYKEHRTYGGRKTTCGRECAGIYLM